MTTLRTKDEVLAVLQAGGFVITRHGSRQNGYGLAAWQNAIKTNIGPSRCRTESVGEIVRWKLA